MLHTISSSSHRGAEDVDEDPAKMKALIKTSIQNIYSDLNEIGLEVQHGGVPTEEIYNQEDFFVLWNRAFMFAADVAPLVSADYLGFHYDLDHVAAKSDAQFRHHFEYLFTKQSGDGEDGMKGYKPLMEEFYFSSGVKRYFMNDNNKQDQTEDSNKNNNEKPFVVFISTERVGFFSKILSRIVSSSSQFRKFILVTGWTDPGPMVFGRGWKYLIESPYVVKWWAQNCDFSPEKARIEGMTNEEVLSSKMQCLPIGIDWHTVARKPYWGLPQLSASRQVERMRELANQGSNFYLNINKQASSLKFTDRTNKILLDFAIGSNTKERLSLWLNMNYFSPLCMSPWTASTYFKASRDDIWRNYLSYRFVLSPPGNGYECHRTYEAMILGAIPIMQLHKDKSLRPAIAKVYEGLPVIFVEDFTCDSINAHTIAEWNKFGEEFWSNQEKVDFMRKKLLNKYWIEKIRNEY